MDKYIEVYNVDSGKGEEQAFARVHITSEDQMDIIKMLSEFGYIEYDEIEFNEPIDFRN